jgi:hypothetical protein
MTADVRTTVSSTVLKSDDPGAALHDIEIQTIVLNAVFPIHRQAADALVGNHHMTHSTEYNC